MKLLVFDMDGVLVDVSDSYRETIARTVESFTGQPVPRSLIQDYKNQGGWNNDWALSQRLLKDHGLDLPYATVVERFQSLLFGSGEDGLILRERWVARPGMLEELSRRYRMSIFTGRPRPEAEHTLRRFVPHVRFDPIITHDDVVNSKPAPDGLLNIGAAVPDCEIIYIGDTLDDARSARAAGVCFIGVAAPSHPWHGQLCDILKREGAIAVIDDINQLESVL